MSAGKKAGSVVPKEVSQLVDRFKAHANYFDKKRTVVDTAYLLYDIRHMTAHSHRTYAHFQRYIKQAGKGKVKASDFKGVDTNALRQMIDDYALMKGPLTSIDLRVFYYMYAMMLSYTAYSCYMIMQKQNEYQEQNGAGNVTLHDRREMYDGDYEEDVRFTEGRARGSYYGHNTRL